MNAYVFLLRYIQTRITRIMSTLGNGLWPDVGIMNPLYNYSTHDQIHKYLRVLFTVCFFISHIL